MRPTAVIGDVHGDSRRLLGLLDLLEPTGRDIIMVGDYINGGSDSRGVLEVLTERWRSAPQRYRFLMGNHELALRRYLSDRDFRAFAAVGGVATLHSYLGEVRGDVHAAFSHEFPESHRRFIDALLPFWESDDVLVSHAGFDPCHPEDRSLRALVTEGHPDIFGAQVYPRPLVVCGHYAQRSQAPYVSSRLICVDTGCGTHSGPLTALLLPERDFAYA